VIDVIRGASRDLPRNDEESPATVTDVTGIPRLIR